MPSETTAEPAVSAPRSSVSNWMSAINAGPTAAPATIAPVSEPVTGPEPAPTAPEPVKAATTSKPAYEAPKVEPAPKAEEPDEDGQVWPRTAKDWKKFTANRKEEKEIRDKRIAEQESKLKEYEEKLSKLPDPTEALTLKERLAQAEKEREDFEQRLRVVAVEKHPKFEAYFNGKINPRIDQAKTLVGPENAERMAELLKMPPSQYRDSQITDIALNLDTLTQARVGAILNELDSINFERNAEIAKANENYQTMTKAEQERNQAETTKRIQSFEKGFKDTVAMAADPKEGMFLFQKRENDAAWNQQVEARIQAAQNLITNNNNTPEAISRAALYAVAMPDLLKNWVETQKAWDAKEAQYQAQIKQLSSANPGGLPNGKLAGAAKTETSVNLPQGTRPMDVSKTWMQKMHEAADNMTNGRS